MFQRVDSLSRPIATPPGWVDPYVLTTIRARAWNRDLVSVETEIVQGTSTSIHRCAVQRAGATWTAVCELRRQRIS
jgi:hypothetical protein